jgi:ACS family glucarate transporter-like MFS transporter
MSQTLSAVSPTPPRTAASPPATRVRWLVLAMLFTVTTINYADRATISIAGADIRKAFDLSPVQMGYIFSAFAWSYVLAQLPGGWLLDRFGQDHVLLRPDVVVALHDVPGAGHGRCGRGGAVLLRLALGAAEAPSFPGNGRITSAWFPANERGLASAIFNSAQYFATALFAPIMGWLVHTFGWQSVFYVMGGLGLALALAWNKVIYGPRAHPWVNQAEIDYIQAGGALVDLDGKEAAARPAAVDTFACIKELLGNRMLLGLYVFQCFINVLTYFFLTWFPVTVSERHMTILKAASWPRCPPSAVSSAACSRCLRPSDQGRLVLPPPARHPSSWACCSPCR